MKEKNKTVSVTVEGDAGVEVEITIVDVEGNITHTKTILRAKGFTRTGRFTITVKARGADYVTVSKNVEADIKEL